MSVISAGRGALGALGVGSLLYPEDSEAGVSSVFRHAPDAARTFAGRVAGDSKAPNPIQGKTRSGLPTKEAAAQLASDLDRMVKNGDTMKELEKRVGVFVHGDTDYNEWVEKIGRVDGGKNGAAYLTGTDIINEELRELLPKRHHRIVDSYTRFRLGPKEQGRDWTKAAGLRDVRGKGFGDKAYYDSLWEETITPQAPANSAMADALRKAAMEETPAPPLKPSKVDRSNLKKGLLGGGGAAGAGSASASTSPHESGFGEPLPTYDELFPEDINTSSDMLAGVPGAAIAGAAPLSLDQWGNLLNMPMSGIHGLARGAWGLLSGEDLVTAGAEAAHLMGSEYKNKEGDLLPMSPGHEVDEGWSRYGEHIETTFNDAGMPEPISKALGIVNQWFPQLLSPF